MTKKLVSLFLSLCLLLGGSAFAAESDEGICVTDMTGRQITLDAPAERIVALTASDCEILYALGAGDTLVGRGTYCNYPAEALEVTEVPSGAETNIELIIALAPDVVLMNTMDQSLDQVAQLEAAGIAVVVNDANTIEEVYTSITIIGAVVGKDEEAAALIDGMKAGFARLKVEPTGKSVYFEISPLEWGLWTAGPGTFMDEIAAMCGLTNIFSDVAPWAQVSEEQVLTRNPDYIVTTAMYYGEGPTPSEEILGRSAWQNISAVSSGRIFEADNDMFTRPGPRLVDAAEAFHAFLYGE